MEILGLMDVHADVAARLPGDVVAYLQSLPVDPKVQRMSTLQLATELITIWGEPPFGFQRTPTTDKAVRALIALLPELISTPPLQRR